MIQVPPGLPSWGWEGRRAWRSGDECLSHWRGWWRLWCQVEQSCAGVADLNWRARGCLGSWKCVPGSPQEICHPLNFHIKIYFRSHERSVNCGRLDLRPHFPCWRTSFSFIGRPANKNSNNNHNQLLHILYLLLEHAYAQSDGANRVSYFYY